MALFLVNANTLLDIDDTGGSVRSMEEYVEEIQGGGIAFETVERHQLSDTVKKAGVGLQEMTVMTIRGKYDNTATSGPHVVLSGRAAAKDEKTTTFKPDGTKKLEGEFTVTKYEVTGRNGEYVMYEAVMVNTAGDAAWS